MKVTRGLVKCVWPMGCSETLDIVYQSKADASKWLVLCPHHRQMTLRMAVESLRKEGE